MKYGDPSTFVVLSDPYKVQDPLHPNDPKAYLWHAPLAARTDWLQFVNPRTYRFGVRIDL